MPPIDLPKAKPISQAKMIFDGVAHGREYRSPRPNFAPKPLITPSMIRAAAARRGTSSSRSEEKFFLSLEAYLATDDALSAFFCHFSSTGPKAESDFARARQSFAEESALRIALCWCQLRYGVDVSHSGYQRG